MFFIYIFTTFLFKYGLCIDEYGINVGTVLFSPTDNSRKCWSNEELALLRARLVFQDVLPKSNALAMEDDKFVTALVSYFRLSVERVKSMTAGKVKEINLKALTDAIGGYLHHVVIPLGKHAFYAGKISYDSARQLTELYDEMKLYLKTDGHTWTPPIKTSNKAKRETPPAGNASSGKSKSGACSNLIYSKTSNGPMSIAMPFLDSKVKPTAVAVPFKTFPLRNLRSKSSAFILAKYYETSIDCMREQNASPNDVSKFNHEFNSFLDSEVIPHLNDEELYSAFGSVYQLKDSISHGGPPATKGGEAGGLTGATGTTNTTNVTDYYNDEDQSTTIMISAVAVVIIIWIITGIIYCCCRMRRKQRDHDKHVIDGSLRRGSSKVVSKSVSKSVSKPESTTSECAPDCKNLNRASRESIKPKRSPLVVNKPPEEKPKEKPKELPKEKEKEPRKDKVRGKDKDHPKVKDHSKDKSKEKPTRKSGGVCPGAGKGAAIPPVPISPKTSHTHPPLEHHQEVKLPPKKPPKCPKCKRSKCGHGLLTVGTAGVKGVRSAPVSLKKSGTYVPEKVQISSSSNTSAEKPVVFGYDFQTSSTDSSSIGETSSSSGSNTPKKL